MLCNLGFSLLNADNAMDAVQTFQNVNKATFRSTIGLAQSYFKVKEYENSYSVYETALDLFENSAKEKSLIYVATSSMIYAFQGENDAKKVLFQWSDLMSLKLSDFTATNDNIRSFLSSV